MEERSISHADELIKEKKKTKGLYSFSHKCKEESGCHACHRKCSLTFNKKSVFCFLKNGSRNVGVTNGSSFPTTCKKWTLSIHLQKDYQKIYYYQGLVGGNIKQHVSSEREMNHGNRLSAGTDRRGSSRRGGASHGGHGAERAAEEI